MPRFVQYTHNAALPFQHCRILHRVVHGLVYIRYMILCYDYLRMPYVRCCRFGLITHCRTRLPPSATGRYLPTSRSTFRGTLHAPCLRDIRSAAFLNTRYFTHTAVLSCLYFAVVLGPPSNRHQNSAYHRNALEEQLTRSGAAAARRKTQARAACAAQTRHRCHRSLACGTRASAAESAAHMAQLLDIKLKT